MLELLNSPDQFGFAAVYGKRRVIDGFVCAAQANSSVHVVVGPLYAIDLITAVSLLSAVAADVVGQQQVIHLQIHPILHSIQLVMHVPNLGRRMIRFLQEKALCDIEHRFSRFFSTDPAVPSEDLSRIFILSNHISLPDC